MKNIITVIHPNEFSCAFVVETDGPANVNDLLELTFAQWNNGSGQECERFIKSMVRSLSVNDVVCINGSYFQCASFGWNSVTPEYVTELENAVANHPSRNEGAWFALHDVMRERTKSIVSCGQVIEGHA